jgi:predicted RNase H-like HicB family nuclease
MEPTMLIEILLEDGLYLIRLQSDPMVHVHAHSIREALKRFSKVLPSFIEAVGVDVLTSPGESEPATVTTVH